MLERTDRIRPDRQNADRWREDPMFKDRMHAAQLLAERLLRYRGQSPLILAIPRGAVPMGMVLAQALDGELDVVLAHKLCAPLQPELAIGGIDESGHATLAPHAASVGATPRWITTEKNRQLQLLQQRRRLYSPWRQPLAVRDRLVIVVDDGLATGATMVAALTAVRRGRPRRLVCAVPVASSQALALIAPLCDESVCLSVPPLFQAVGQFYQDFPQVSDEDVARCLQQPGLWSALAAQPGNSSASCSDTAAASLAASKG
jgi:predicted phosphoribosyltransferase